MKTAAEILNSFENIRRAQTAGVYAPHKPLLILLALARVQRGEPRLMQFADIDSTMKRLLTEFGRTGAANTRHNPFWHLATDGQGALWDFNRPADWLDRAAGATPTLGELRQQQARAGFPPEIDDALRHVPGLLQTVAARMLEAYFPTTLHGDITAALGLDLDGPPTAQEGEPHAAGYAQQKRRRRDPGFRERVLRAYEYRCCVCGFSLRIGHMPAGLEAAHIEWHNIGGPDTEQNGLSLCALHHKLFDLGVFTVEPAEHRLLFSQHAISEDRGVTGGLQFHGRRIHAPQHRDLLPAAVHLNWNSSNVFKAPARPVAPIPADS